MTTWTYIDAVRVANAAGRDAGNRSCERGGRCLWSEEDRDAARQACNAVLTRLGFGHLVED